MSKPVGPVRIVASAEPTVKAESKRLLVPLNERLRAEASAWDEGEPIIGLLIEAAEGLEILSRKMLEMWDASQAASARRNG